MIVADLRLRDFRSYERLELELQPGTVLVVGPNGAGKTNLLEALHVGTQGFSPRTRTDAQLVRFGAEAGRVVVAGRRQHSPVEVEVTLRRGEGKRVRLNGAPLASADDLRSELATLVFTPDRLAVVKGGPAVRRAYFDRALGRLSPARAAAPLVYSGVLAQRNAALRRVAARVSGRDALAPWTEQLATRGEELVEARRAAIATLAPVFAERAGELGLPAARLVYVAEAPGVEQLEAELDRDLDRGWTGSGPHVDDVGIVAGARELRAFGSQGEQRLAVLSLILAEAALLAERGRPPLLLLDDVLSELDSSRRSALAERLAAGGQTVVTATSAGALPREPTQLVEVELGRAVSATPAPSSAGLRGTRREGTT
ncbi:MAG: DNA replication/repair protein RecF [Gaiellaceae bacterium]